MQETLGAVRVVKQMNAEEFETAIQANILTQVGNQYQYMGKRLALITMVANLFLYLGLTLTLWYGAECVFGSKLCPQSISFYPYKTSSVLIIGCGLMFPALSFNQLTPSVEKIGEGIAAVSKIYAIIDR